MSDKWTCDSGHEKVPVDSEKVDALCPKCNDLNEVYGLA